MSTVSLAVEKLEARVVGVSQLALGHGSVGRAIDEGEDDTREDDTSTKESDLHVLLLKRRGDAWYERRGGKQISRDLRDRRPKHSRQRCRA